VQAAVTMTDTLTRLRAYAYAQARRLTDVVARRLCFHSANAQPTSRPGGRNRCRMVMALLLHTKKRNREKEEGSR
jgi:hypothetical protein